MYLNINQNCPQELCHFGFEEINIEIDIHQAIVFVLPISVDILPHIFWGEDFIFHNIIPVAISLTLNNNLT